MRGFAFALSDLYEEFKDECDFVTVYIAEAHAQDKWPISSARYNGKRGPVRIEECRTNEDRCRVAAAFVRNYNYTLPMVCDPIALKDGSPGEAFERLFAPWPVRFYIVKNGKMALIAEPDNCEYSLVTVRDWLLKDLGRPLD